MDKIARHFSSALDVDTVDINSPHIDQLQLQSPTTPSIPPLSLVTYSTPPTTDRNITILTLNGDITFFTTPMYPELHNLRAMTINPSNLNSLTQLPGVETIMSPSKELLEKISNTYLPVQDRIDNLSITYQICLQG